MALADFKCSTCGKVVERETDKGTETKLEDCKESCNFARVWSPVSIGRVKNAGGSPPR